MKLGVFTVFAIFTQLLAQQQHMVSVFILGYNVGTIEEIPNPTTNTKEKQKKPNIKKNEDGVVRFRAIIFKSLQNSPPNKLASYDDIDWAAYFAVDFDITMSQLKKDFLNDMFNDLSFKCEINYNLKNSQSNKFESIGNKNYKLRVFGVDLETKDTHLGSLITNYDITKDAYLSVYKDGLKILLSTNKNAPDGSLFNFKVSPNFQHKLPCMNTKKPSTFKIQSIPKKKIPNSSYPPWNDATYMIETSLVEADKTIKYLPNFKVNSKNKTINVFVAVNSIPIRRHFADVSFREIDIAYEIPYLIIPILETNLNDRHLPFTSESALWNPLSSQSPDLDATYKDEKLISKWQILDEVISMTIHFNCVRPNVFPISESSSNNLLI